MITAEMIDERIKFCREYGKLNLGIKNGPDFPGIGRILMGSKEFESVALLCSLMGMLPMIGHKPSLDETEAEKAKFMSEFSAGTKEPLAMMFYVGYRLGKADGEGSQLEKLGALCVKAYIAERKRAA